MQPPGRSSLVLFDVQPTASLTIAELLSGPLLFNVPVYQRPFSWGRDQAEQLLDDLLEAAGLGLSSDPEPDYFLGTVLLMDTQGAVTERIHMKMPVREFDIVDGQQRMVTLLTMVSVLRDLEGNKSKPVGKRVQAINFAQLGTRFFRTARFRLHVASQERAFFEEYVLQAGSTLLKPATAKLATPEAAILAVRDYLMTALKDYSDEARAVLFDYVTRRCHAVVIISHDIDRAHRMFVVLNERGKKLQRNDILKADLLSRMTEADSRWAVTKWDEVSARLGEDFESLFAHIRVIYGYSRPQIVSSIRAVVRESGGAEPFFKDAFLPLARAYELVRSNGEGVLPPEMTRLLHYLNRLPDGDWAPAAMVALKDWEADPQRAAQLLIEIDRLAHLMRLLCIGTTKRVRRFADLTAAIRTREAVGAGHPVVQLTREELRNLAFHLKDLHKRNPKACKLLLLRLSDEIGGSLNPVSPEHYTIEHVLPQRPSATSEWRKWFPTAEERGQCVDSLGNLVLISQKQNDKARNASLDAKKVIYSSDKDIVPILPITLAVIECAEWRRQEIEMREEQLFTIIEKIWRVDLVGSKPQSRAATVPADSPQVAQPLRSMPH